MIERRAALAGLLAAAAPTVARAQAPRALRKIGYLHPTTIAPDHATLVSLRRAWRELGYVEGETVLLRSAEGDLARLPSLVAELIRLDVGVLIMVGAATVKAASETTATLPIVAIDLETDPVRAGYAGSIARPGRNITGLFMDTASLAGKWIELLREAAPTIDRVALVWDPKASPDQLAIAKAAAHAIGMKAVVVEARLSQNYDEVFGELGRAGRTGLVQLTTPGSAPWFSSFATAAIANGLPSITFQKVNAQAGALMSYGSVNERYFPRAVVLADRILKGTRPGDLPIEHPVEFELVLNLKTAKALRLALPGSLLARADEVIE